MPSLELGSCRDGHGAASLGDFQLDTDIKRESVATGSHGVYQEQS